MCGGRRRHLPGRLCQKVAGVCRCRTSHVRHFGSRTCDFLFPALLPPLPPSRIVRFKALGATEDAESMSDSCDNLIAPGFVVLHGVTKPCKRILHFLGCIEPLVSLASIYRIVLYRLRYHPDLLPPIRRIVVSDSVTRRWYLELLRENPGSSSSDGRNLT